MNGLQITSDSFNIFKALEIANIYSGKQISLKVNTNINHYERIVNLFKKKHIAFESIDPDAGNPKRFDIHFGNQTDFQDLFIIIAILKIFGLQSIFYSGDKNNEVFIGSYISEYGPQKDISDGLSSDDFLNLPFMMTTSELLQTVFNCEIVNKFTETEKDYYYNVDHFERESYGQYAGSYAQDVEGLSDDFINDVLDGDPDAYWNID